MPSHHSPAQLANFAIRGKNNHDAMLYFGLSMASLASAFTLFYLAKAMAIKIKWSSDHPTKPLTRFISITRWIRSLLLHKGPYLPSMGHAVVVFLYLATNLALMFGHMNLENMTFLSVFASRTGWLAIANLLVVIFLALKNTPLAFLLPWSYERLNVLHQVSGSVMLLQVVLHASCYSGYFVSQGRASRLFVIDEIYGMVAAISFFLMVASAIVVRNWWYEAFYYTHIILWILGIVMTGLHQPELAKKIVIVTCIAGGIWVLDRLIRMTRIALYSISNEVILQPLPRGGTRVTLKKAPLGTTSGKHCFLWIPAVRAFEAHPFTIASTDPLEFVISSHDGFTRDLHRYALENRGSTFKASVDGPYGKIPSPESFDKVVLIAGGSGASFTFGAALNTLKKMSDTDDKRIEFIWIVKEHTQLTWFDQHIKTIESDSRVSVRLYVTRTPVTELHTVGTADDKETLVDDEMQLTTTILGTNPEKDEQNDGDTDSVTSSAIAQIHTTPSIHARPDIPNLVRSSIAELDTCQRVLVMACGPPGLMDDVRNTTASCIRGDGPGIELHCEYFGW